MKKITALTILLTTTALLAGCSSLGPGRGKGSPEEAKRLEAIIQEYSETTKRIDPYYATYFNVEEDLAKFGDYPSPAYYERSRKTYETALGKLKGIDFEALPEKDRRTYRLFKEDMEVSLKNFDFPNPFFTVTQMWSRLQDYMDQSSQDLTSFPFDSVKHYDDFVKRSEGFPAYVDQQIAVLREGMRNKIVLSCIVAKKVPNTYKDALQKKIEKNPFYRPVGFMPKDFPEADRARLAKDFRAMVKDRLLPGYEKFDAFFRKEYLKSCRAEFGLGSFPQGAEWYKQEIRSSTNLDLDAKYIHETGLNEVARIAAEIEKIQKKIGFKGTLPQFLKSVSTDQKYYFKTAPEMLAAFEKVRAEIEKKIPSSFDLIPKSEFKLVESSNPEDAAGSYKEPTENLPYGRFVVNTTNVRSVGKFGVTTLMLHETVPGHHFQLALQFEMKDRLSEYQRKMYGSNAFVEGWALYAEYLGNEMGLYEDPLQRLGNLNDEMLRAVRLVVDTGIHAMGWSQKKAIDYARRYLASDAKGIEVESNRYSVWPGQALGYKIGQLKILELRQRAERELGPGFDIKGFHRAVIGNGTVSLGVLESQVDEWIAQSRR